MALVVYRFPPGVVPRPQKHGNAIEDRPFFPTWASTKQLVKTECQTCGPKETVHRVSDKVGGLVSSSCPGQLPRNERQVKYVRSASKATEYNPADELYSVMFKAKQEDSQSMFVQDVRVLPDPALVLANDYQLDDLVRFAANPLGHCVLTIDPTFSLGEFDVTPITYRHLLLESRRTGKPPVCIGPILVHYRKTYPTYLFFASSLVGLRRELRNAQAFGTDGEEALADAFSHVFKTAVRLTCAIHKRRNIEAKLKDLGVGAESRGSILDDIFGKQRGVTYFEGLVDATDDATFDSKLQVLRCRWLKVVPEIANVFHAWFVKYEAAILRDTMIRPVREAAGLGSPPDQFSTNASEAINKVLKVKVDYKRSDLPAFVSKVKELIADQRKELEAAIVNCGKFKLKEEYSFLETAEHQWYQKSPHARQALLKRFHKTTVQTQLENSDASTLSMGANVSIVSSPSMCALGSVATSPAGASSSTTSSLALLAGIASGSSVHTSVATSLSSASASGSASTCLTLSVGVSDIASRSSVPTSVFFWSKALELTTSAGAMAPAPGCAPSARTVRSSSKSGFHLVTPAPCGKFTCDCPNYHSLSICSHTVAVAEVNGKLEQFVEWYCKSKKSPSLSRLALKDIPKGCGRKGSKPPRKRMKAQPISKRLDPIALSNTGDTNEIGACICASSAANPTSEVHVPAVSKSASSMDRHATHTDADAAASHWSHSCNAAGTGYTGTIPAYSYVNPTGTPFTPRTTQLFADTPCGAFSPHTPQSSAIPPYPSFGTNPWHPVQPGLSGSQASLPWWHSSYVSHGNQSVQQFINSPYPDPHTTCTFRVRFIEGNISTCYGCRNKYSKKPEPPDNICLQTEEWREFTSHGALVPQKRWSNTYYHVRKHCVQLKWRSFKVIIDDNIKNRLLQCHKDLIMGEVGQHLYT